MLASYSYDAFARMLKIAWEPPKYTQKEIMPFIPEESELDALIAACKSKRMACFLQVLKETFADPGEAIKIEWTDISGNIITINHPVKNHLPRQLQVSQRLLSMLSSLPRTSTFIFPTRYVTMNECFKRVRARAAQTLQNPRLQRICFTTFRHWGGTMIAHYSGGNVLTVKKILGHKNVNNTMKYIGMIHFKDDEFDIATATTVEEAKTILAAGFDYITEKSGIMLFRKPKRFKSLV
jgi:integrase